MAFVKSTGDLFYFLEEGDEEGSRVRASVLVNKKGKLLNTLGAPEPVLVCDGITLAGLASSEPITDVQGGEYILDAQWTGPASGLRIDALGADGVQWREGPTIDAPGSIELKIGAEAVIRITNVDAVNAADDVYVRLS